MATLSDFRTVISSTLGLDNTPGSDEQQLIDLRVNEGIVQVLRHTRLRVLIANLDLTVDERDYELPAGIMFVTQIVDANERPLEQVPPEKIFDYRRASQSTAGPSFVYAVNGANMIMFYPTPTQADTLTFYYVPTPTPLLSPTDDPSASANGGIQREYHTAIENYALWKLADYADDATSQQGDRYQRDFFAEIAKIRAAVRRRGAGRLPPARLRYPRDTRFIGSSPSQGWWFV